MAPSRGRDAPSPSPPRSTWSSILLLVAALQTAQAQQLLTLPALERFDLTAGASTSFRISPVAIAAGAKTATYFVTLNVCTPPSTLGLDVLATTTLLLASNSSSLPAPTRQQPGNAAQASAPGGFANITFSEPANANNGMWVGVTAPDGAGSWSFELGASTTAPMHIVDRHPLFAVDDTDATTALMTGPTYVPAIDGRPARQALVIPISNSATPPQLAASSCFLRQSTALVPQSNINETVTNRGVAQLTQREGATGEALRRTLAGGVRTQYLLGPLQRGTNYSVWGLEGTGQVTAAGDQGLRIFVPQYLRTKTGDNCRLVHDMAACPAVAYAVPAPPILDTASLLALYTSLIAPHLTNFNVSLSTFPCNDPVQGMYSYVRTCVDCLTAYTNWLCSVVMPRCDDVPSNQLASAQALTSSALSSDTNASVSISQPLDARPFPQLPLPPLGSTAPPPSLIIRSDPSLSRTSIWGASSLANLTSSNATLAALALTPPFPYAEPPPCSSLCHLVAASCPPVMGWACPLAGVSLEAGYGALRNIPGNTQQGGDQQVSSQGWGRPADRFGNVYCNALGSDVLLAKRTGGANEVRVSMWAVVLGTLLAILYTR